ncbi:type II toxin-antitoxin system HicA family toxin [Nitrosomonas sp. Nm33]|uniref:type II toxin-antitoxin system HicA family toxin n=1 Tax=Nitrosomonas sp. Nm33 TaxID=133724 RepID=UPI0008960FB5|nr:type II toxin-antitoxin system HicA family toxin [Nitrosomonas sp. Nm33]SDY00391.1 Predicted RNA binding protein YcfA, dsRBD-like fold, HicA-like mRNA interferase family [Nitrosomonas sp. Nm33]
MNGNEIIKRLKSEGWRVKRIRGSHYMMEKDGCVVPVPAHSSTEIGKSLLSAIEKQTGVKLR